MNILVTGTAGFIGSHLVDRLLTAGYKVIGIDNFNDYYDPAIKEANIQEHLTNSGYQLYRIDITDEAAMQSIFDKHNIDLVVHLAARAGVRPSIKQPQLYNRVNLIGTTNILELMRKSKISKLVFASSSSVYGNNEKVPFSEEDIVDFPISPYAATKKAGELLCHTYHHLYGLDIFCLRLFTVYGPRQRPEMAISKFTRLILEEEILPIYSEGKSSRDYTYIDDIIDGIMASIKRVEGYEILNIGGSDPIQLMDLVHLLEEVIGKKAELDLLPDQPGDVRTTYADIQKAKRLLDYAPDYPIKKGLEQYVEWYLHSANRELL